jgi:hypothetical protein
MDNFGGLVPTAPPIPVRAPAPAEQIEREVQRAATIATGRTAYCGDITFSWLERLTAWFRRRS